jgi:DNA polymerase-3 subunit gamma/tau
LEEPPDHVIFVLATTNPEKLIPTIRSRCVNILFKKPTTQEIFRRQTRVVAGEKIKADSYTLEAIAKASEGSFRDAHKILDQAVSEGKSLKSKDIKNLLAGIGEGGVERLLNFLAERDVKKALDEVNKVVLQGVSTSTYLESILQRLRAALLAEVGIKGEKLKNLNKKDLISLIKKLSEVQGQLKDSLIEELPLEVAIVEWCEDASTNLANGNDDEKKETSFSNKKKEKKKKVKIDTKSLKKIGDGVWVKILNAVKPKNTSIEALLRAARPIGFDGRTLTLGVFYSFHKERLENGYYRQILENAVAGVFGRPVRIVCRLTEPPKKKIEKDKDVILTEGSDEDIIKVAEEIFGS